MKEALYYIRESDKKVRCNLCPHHCLINPSHSGICKIRFNRDGRLSAEAYSLFAAVNLDPIEKKPLYHFYPGSMILSVGTAGCNFRCLHCQNWDISQSSLQDIGYLKKLLPQDALSLAKKTKSIGIAYTYNEPLINFEWVLETSKIFASAGLKNVLVTNGYLESEPWQEITRYTDAANIDVKSFSEDFYKKICGGKLEVVLRNVEFMAKAGKHIEITYLVIPSLNDEDSEIEKMVGWLSGINPEIPLHFTRYFPSYKMNHPPTPLSTLERVAGIARKKLKYVHLGNV